ncbi:hypothetical protein H9L09_10975 [Nocardioides mesophilus]|uniref:SRPBCC family protein n=2 Tax=Nocardioides mesophilus TaxID=433659 RepID=A0A7G9RHA6_9ACTN|nr:hypothetical protein H9L09_10975 [Nocardioides mesophilus]
MRTWGSTRQERRMELPGDEVVSDVMAHYTKAITIDAPPAVVWPWVVQMGDHRAGFYSHDWIERFVFGGTVHYVEKTHSATRIHPELQDLHVGDRLDTGSIDGFSIGTPVKVLEPERALVAGMAWILQPLPGNRTRLLLRDRDAGWLRELVPRAYVVPRLLLGAVDYLVGDPLHFVMERRMLLGLKERSEKSLSEGSGVG